MTNYFDDGLHFRDLERELKSWEGTKYSPHGICRKRIGSDCVGFVVAVLVATGAIPPLTLPQYVRKNGGAAMLDLLLQIMDGIPQLRRVWNLGEPLPERAKRGWVLVISTGRAHHHLSIVGNPPQVWHCLEKVEQANFADSSIRNHLFAIYESNG
jgi:hypothetical protein